MTINSDFFGLMFQGDWIQPDGDTRPISSRFGTFRAWNNGASYEYAGAGNWDGFDRVQNYVRRNGKRLLYTMAGEVGTPIPTLSNWMAFTGAVLRRSQGNINIIEPWNEPVYSTTTDAKEFVRLSVATHTAIKDFDPTIVVLTPSLSAFLPYEKQFSESYLSNLGKPIPADGVAFHGYCEYADQLYDIIHWFKHRTDLPLYLTEISLLSPDPLKNLSRTFEICEEEGVKLCVWDGQNEGADASQVGSPLGIAFYNVQAELLHPGLWRRIKALFRKIF